MGYVHKTPAWAGPLGAKDRYTYWGVVPSEPGRGGRQLPPHPDEVALPGTFGAWYRMASANLGLAERLDIGLSRVLAGGGLILLQFAGLLPIAGLLAAEFGLPLSPPEPWTVVSGAMLLAVTWAGWAWYRSRWTRAWELRKAWSLAIYDPAVLALPAEPVALGEERDIDTDPEATHPYRARELFAIEERAFVDRVVYYLLTDRARPPEALRCWPLVAASYVVVFIVPTMLMLDSVQATVILAALALAMLPPLVSAWCRYGRRLWFAYRLARLETHDRQRWIGWRMLRDGERPTGRAHTEGRPHEPRPVDRDHAMAGSQVCRILALRVLSVPVPVTGRTTVPPGRWTLELWDGGSAHLVPADPSEAPDEVTVTGIISGFNPHEWRGWVRRHWLVLSDGAHIPVDCHAAAVLDAGESLGIEVVRPRTAA